MVDQYFFPEITAEVADRVGLRALLTFPVIDVETAWARDADHVSTAVWNYETGTATTTASKSASDRTRPTW